MDSTLIVFLSGITGAVVGGLFAVWATNKQIKVVLAQTSGSVNERLYSQNLQIMQFIAEHPNLYPYFFRNKDFSEAKHEEERVQILSTADMIVGFMDLVSVLIGQLPKELRPNWESYVMDQYRSSSVLRRHIHSHACWYSSSVLNFISGLEKRLAGKSRT